MKPADSEEDFPEDFLRRNDNRISVETSPVQQTGTPKWVIGLGSVLLVCWALALVAHDRLDPFGVVARSGISLSLPGMVLGFICFLGGKLYLDQKSQPRLDAEEGELTWGLPGFRQRRPTSDIVAIQLVRQPVVGKATFFFRVSPSPFGQRVRVWYQLILVFVDSATPRLLGAAFVDPSEARLAGQKLAGLLKVPLLDQTNAR